MQPRMPVMLRKISTHTSLAGRDAAEPIAQRPPNNFYSHVPRGTRPVSNFPVSQILNFYSHVPRGTRRCSIGLHGSVMEFLLTRPSRDATKFMLKVAESKKISTHTSLAGRDTALGRMISIRSISTHTSLAGRD